MVKSPRMTQSTSSKRERAFTLIEIVLAIGVVSFAMVAILGTLPVGIQTMKDGMEQQAKATIAQHVRSELQQMPFESDDASDEYTLAKLDTASRYYTPEGMPTESGAQNVYFEAKFDVEPASINNATGSASPFSSASARRVIVTLFYPVGTEASKQKSLIFSLLAARQKEAH